MPITTQVFLYHKVLKIKNSEYKLKCSKSNYKGCSNLTQANNKYVHVQGEYPEKNVQYEIGKKCYRHAMIKVLG